MRLFRIPIATLICLAAIPLQAAMAEPTLRPAAPDTTANAALVVPGVVVSPALQESAEMDDWSVSWDVSYASKYIWQGLDFGEDEPGLQPELILGYGGFSGTVWMHQNLGRGVPTEVDYSLGYQIERERYTANAGYSYFRYPNQDGTAPSHEVLAGLDLGAFLDPSLTVHYDFAEGRGLYGSLGLSRTWENLPLSVTLGIEGYYHSGYYGMSGCPAIACSGETSFNLRSLTFSPAVSYFATRDNGDFRGASAVPAVWVFSFNVAQSF